MTFFFSKKKSSKTGVTLTELLVVVAIITIITAIMVINFRAGERGGKLVRSAQLLIQGIRNAQNMALGSKESYTGTSWEVPEGGYGVYINKLSPNNNQCIIYADFDNQKDYDASEAIETVKLEEGIVIDFIFYVPSEGDPDKTSITFDPLGPLISLQPAIPPADKIYITIRKSEVDCSSPSTCREFGTGCPSGCKVIKLLKAGWVSVVN